MEWNQRQCQNYRSWVSHVQEVFLRWRSAPVPTTGCVRAADAGVLPSLLPIQAVIQQPVSPQALVFSCRCTWHCVTGVDLRGEEFLIYSFTHSLIICSQIWPLLHHELVFCWGESSRRLDQCLCMHFMLWAMNCDWKRRSKQTWKSFVPKRKESLTQSKNRRWDLFALTVQLLWFSSQSSCRHL